MQTPPCLATRARCTANPDLNPNPNPHPDPNLTQILTLTLTLILTPTLPLILPLTQVRGAFTGLVDGVLSLRVALVRAAA